MKKPEKEGMAGHLRGHAGIAGGEDQDVVTGRQGPADITGHADVEHQAARAELGRLDAVARRRGRHHDRGFGQGPWEIHVQPRSSRLAQWIARE